MSTREVKNMPDTSKSAYLALTPEKLRGDYGKIISALKILGSGTYEQISDYLNCREPNIISRRMKELQSMSVVYKPGEKRLTKRNRSAYVYKLVQNGEISAQKEKVMEGKSVADYAQSIIHFDDESFNPIKTDNIPF